jgi:hypothetical protein
MGMEKMVLEYVKYWVAVVSYSGRCVRGLRLFIGASIDPHTRPFDTNRQAVVEIRCGP